MASEGGDPAPAVLPSSSPPHRSSPRCLPKFDASRQKLVISPLSHNFTTQLLLAGVSERVQKERVGRPAGTGANAGSLKVRCVKQLAEDARAVVDGWLLAVLMNQQTESSDRPGSTLSGALWTALSQAAHGSQSEQCG
jgi:hypothetical protein